MWLDKLSDGVLRVATPVGTRYFRPAFWQRLYLLWIFRYFDTLPLQVLSPRQQKFIDELCADPRFAIAPRPHNRLNKELLLGTVDRRPSVLVEPPAKQTARESVANSVTPLAPDLQQRS